MRFYRFMLGLNNLDSFKNAFLLTAFYYFLSYYSLFISVAHNSFNYSIATV